MPKPVKTGLALLAILLVLFLLCGLGLNLAFPTISYSFYKNATSYPEAAAGVQPQKFILEETEDGALAGYARIEDYSTPAPTVLYFGGSGEIAFNAVCDYAATFAGYNLLCVDWPGSGESRGAGAMRAAGMLAAALALYDHAAGLPYVDEGNISVVGYSYGTGPATYVAAERATAKLVLVAPYRDVKDLYNAILPVFHSPLGWFVSDDFDAKAYAADVEAPTLIVTSDADERISSAISLAQAEYFADAQTLQAAGLAHTEYWQDAAVVETVRQFIGGS